MHTWRTIAMHTNLRLTLGTGSWIISVWYKLACIAFSPISYQIFTTSHNTNLATIHSQVTIGSCLMEYEYKLLCQFTTTVGGTKCYLWLKQSQNNSHMITSESLSLWKYSQITVFFMAARFFRGMEFSQNYNQLYCRKFSWQASFTLQNLMHSCCFITISSNPMSPKKFVPYSKKIWWALNLVKWLYFDIGKI